MCFIELEYLGNNNFKSKHSYMTKFIIISLTLIKLSQDDKRLFK